jgi:hypothetical protein
MAATVLIHSWHGSAPGSGSDITGADFRFGLTDGDALGTSSPVVVPAAGYAYSYVKNLRLYVSVTPASVIDNIKFYSDGVAWGTGIQVMAKTAASYVDPIANADAALIGTTDAVTYTSASPLSVSGSLSNPNTGNLGDFVVLQARIASTAAPGIYTGRTYTFRYDEI